MDSVVSFFANKHSLTSEQASEIAKLFVQKHVARQQVVLSAGELWREATLIQAGILRLYYTTEDGKEFNKGFFAEGQLLWPMAPTARAESSLFSIAAIDTCALWVADFKRLRSTLEQFGRWESFALPYVETLADQKFLREYQFLVYDAQQRYELALQELGPLVQRLPDYHLASYLGITHIALSRIKAKLRSY